MMTLAVLLTGCGAEQAVKKGDKFFALGEYFDAATQYKKAYSQTPAKERALRGQRALKMAECYRHINYTQKAIAAYNNAIRYKQADSLTHLYLAQQLMKNGSYKEAAKQFQEFLDSMGNERDEEREMKNGEGRNISSLITLARTGLKSAQQAPEWKKQGSDYTVKRENFFNSIFIQINFSVSRKVCIFVSQKDEKGKWQRPEVIDSELNSDFDEGVCSFSPDGRTMYLTQCKTDPDYPRFASIMTSNRSDASWSKATELKLTRDTLSTFAHPAVSPDGQWLYFCSNMPGGLGGYDIWRVRLTTSGVGGVENLGAPINTPGNEMFPTFRPNGDLYFSSDGHEGLGGLDIYIAKIISNEELEIRNYDNPASPDSTAESNYNSSFLISNSSFKISHPGYPLNSQGDDFGMTFEGLKNQGYFSSNRGDGKGWDHIYLKLSVKGDGSFTQEIKAGVDYVFLGTCKGFLNHQEQLHVEPVTKSEEYTLQFPLASITAPVLIDNIFYDFDKATLRPESAEALDQLVKLLNENPHVTIELSAHTDYKGSDQYNERLSQRRAESVVKYLIEHGIASDRLTPKGYGEEKPKKIRRKVTEKYPFLKENDVLTEEFIKTLEDEEQQEQCNQLNRRTEFKVLRTTYGLFKKN